MVSHTQAEDVLPATLTYLAIEGLCSVAALPGSLQHMRILSEHDTEIERTATTLAAAAAAAPAHHRPPLLAQLALRGLASSAAWEPYCDSIVSLDLSGGRQRLSGDREDQLQMLAKLKAGLTHLQLNSCVSPGLSRICLKQLTQLRELQLVFNPDNGQDVPVIETHGLQKVLGQAADVFESIAALPLLASLSLGNVAVIGSASVMQKDCWEQLTSLSGQLTCLELERCGLDDVVLQRLLHSLRHLVRLSLIDMPCVTDAPGTMDALKQHPSLHVLMLYRTGIRWPEARLALLAATDVLQVVRPWGDLDLDALLV